VVADFRLAPLLTAARLRFESAEQRLAVLRRRWDAARDKLTQLERFQAEYAGQLRSAQALGLEGYRQRDYVAFLAKLELAANQQKEEVARAHQAWEAGFADWSGLKSRLEALEALEARHLALSAQRERRQDQKLQDEFAARRGRNLPEHH